MDSKNLIIEGFSVIILSTIHESFCCFLCSNILVNAHQAPCGCRFCFECIKDYLKESDKICPGKSEDCFEQKLNIESDLRIDILAKREINKLSGKCPLPFCDEVCELREMANHLRICASSYVFCSRCNENIIRSEFVNHVKIECLENIECCEFCNETMKRRNLKGGHHDYKHVDLCSKYIDFCPNECEEKNKVVWIEHRRMCSMKLVSCPYQNVGCISSSATLTEISHHLLDNVFDHAEILLKHIDNLNNEIACLNSYLCSVTNEIKVATDKGGEEQNTDNIANINKAVDEIRKENACMLPKLHNYIKTEVVSFMEGSKRRQSLNLEEMNVRITKIGSEMKTMKNNYDNIFFRQINNVIADNILMKKEIEELKNKINVPEDHQKKPVLIWKIGNYSNINKIGSPIFCSHPLGYRLDLSLEKDKKGFVSLFVRLYCGENDDKLSWPFRKSVTVKIKDQEKLNRDYVRVIHFDYKAGFESKRQYGSNTGDFGLSEFISFKDLNEKYYLLLSNTLLIHCFVDELEDKCRH